jgi:hypothetical protein
MTLLRRILNFFFSHEHPMTPVDVEAMLVAMESRSPQRLNWRESIVDLLKLIDMESDMASRRKLADQLAVRGDYRGTAEQNVALHKALMRELAKNGGKVPKELL